MADEGAKTAGRVALCSAVCAGFAYVGYSFFVKMVGTIKGFGRKGKKEGSRKGQSNKSVQTDLTVNCSLSSYLPHFRSSLNSKRCLKELNLRTCHFVRDSLHFFPYFKARSLQSSPKTSPRILSIDNRRKFLSLSAENISMTSPTTGSPDTRSNTTSPVTHTPISRENVCRHSTSCLLNDRNAINSRLPFVEDFESHLKTVQSLYTRPRELTVFEVKSIVALLHSKDEDLLVRTLTTVSNCAAFSANQDLLCNAGSLVLLKDLLIHPSEAVKVASTQAVSNLAVSEKSQMLFQPLLPILLNHTSLAGGELLRALSVTALANLALDRTSHNSLIENIHCLMQLLEEGSTTVCLQTLRLLVNLSCNIDMVPQLLSTKVPCHLYEFLDLKKNRDITLRCITFLANIVTAVAKWNICTETMTSLRESLYSFLYGPSKTRLLNKITLLLKSEDEDICVQAKRIQDILRQ